MPPPQVMLMPQSVHGTCIEGCLLSNQAANFRLDLAGLYCLKEMSIKRPQHCIYP